MGKSHERKKIEQEAAAAAVVAAHSNRIGSLAQTLVADGRVCFTLSAPPSSPVPVANLRLLIFGDDGGATALT